MLPWVDVATGSLGQGLPDGVGVALAGKYLDRVPFRVWVLCGDSELSEGSIWEALDKARHYELSNLIAIVDVNRLGQRGPTELGWDLDAYARRVEAFGAHAVQVDGHDLTAVDEALSAATGEAEKTDCDSRPDHQGPGVLRGRRSRGLAREGVPGGDGGASDRGARRGERTDRARTAPRVREPERRRVGARGKPGDLASELCAR